MATALVGLVLVASVGVAIFARLRTRQKGGHCGNCAGCPGCGGKK